MALLLLPVALATALPLYAGFASGAPPVDATPIQKTDSAGTPFSALLSPDIALDDDTVRRYLKRAGGTPIIEGDDAIFVVESPELLIPRITGDVEPTLTRLGQTHFFYGRAALRLAARVEYRIRIGEAEALDPLNPRRIAAFVGENSEIRMPGHAASTRFAAPAPAARGRVSSFDHASPTAGNSRRVHVYVPHGYETEPTRRYPVVWFNDGTAYVEQIGVPGLLDGLIAHGRVEPLIAVFVDPVSRGLEYGGHPAFRALMTDELVPLIDERFRTERNAARRAMVGGSRGGMGAIDLALSRPDVFALCGAWAPAISPKTVADFIGVRKSPGGRFALIQSQYDARFGPDAPALRDGLRSAGGVLHYAEVPEGHTRGAWPSRVVEVLTTLLPAR